MSTSPLESQARLVKAASREVSTASSATRDAFLRVAADQLEAQSDKLLEANAGDLHDHAASLTSAAADRLRLTAERISSMAEGLRKIAALPDPVGEIVDGWRRPNGIEVSRVRVPLGVIGIVYENRPNVTSDAAGLCIKAGNAVFLRGSSTAQRSNVAIVAVLQASLETVGLPRDAVSLVEDSSHETAAEFMGLRGYLDCLIPRGGPSLIASMRAHATVPYILDGDGNCHTYVDRAADLEQALDIIENAKVQRPGVCNATETLLVHRGVAAQFLPAVDTRLASVELRGCPETVSLVPRASAATTDDWATEFSDLILAIRVVTDLDEAMEHIRQYSTGHTEAILTEDLAAASTFCRTVDAAAVVVNASTRFVDGEELGLGAEIGISTQKLHARGPMGLRELTTAKWILRGEGQVRT